MIDQNHPAVRARRHVHAAIQKVISEVDPPEGGPGVVKAWVVAADIVLTDGGRQMYSFSADANGETELVPWERDGLLHYAIYDFQVEDE